MRRVTFGGLQLSLPDGWEDITDADDPPTLARSEGDGALQFSTARYTGGIRPAIHAEQLSHLLRNFLATHQMAATSEPRTRAGKVTSVSIDVARPKEYWRLWYLSDGDSVAFITYVTLCPAASGLQRELEEAEQIVSSAHFGQPQ